MIDFAPALAAPFVTQRSGRRRKLEKVMAEQAFSFLLQYEDQPFLSSRCYIVADPSLDDSKQWTIQFEQPQDAAWVYQLDDMKDWMLHGPKAVRQIVYDRKNPRTPFRNLERNEVFRAYVRKVLEKLPAEHQSRRKFALMPSIASEETRTRYKDALEAAIPGVTVIPEPEMVAEYFRLMKRTLELEAGRNNVLLVVDVGASTANMTLILSRRDSTVIDLDSTGAQRDLRLRALRGDSVGHAGRWIDKRLAEILQVDPSDEVLREIEKAKVRSSSGEKAISFSIPGVKGSLSIDQATLSTLAGELWSELRPLFEKLCERLYENQTSSEDAKRKSETRLRELGVETPGEAHRLIDTILLAGGTSLLPGFQEAMMVTLFPDGHRPQVLRVGSSFAVAAAAGGLAHLLHNYDPPRLREPNAPGRDVFTATLEATLPYSLMLGIKQAADSEQQITALDANDPFVDDGGRRPIEGLPALAKGSQPKMRLVPGLAAGVLARQGRQFKAMRVRNSPVRMELEWDPARERATIHSREFEETGHLWIDAHQLRKRQEPALDVFDEPLEANALAVDAADDVVLDLGMSKIVAVTAKRGWISTEELERILREGYSSQFDLPRVEPKWEADPQVERVDGVSGRRLERPSGALVGEESGAFVRLKDVGGTSPDEATGAAGSTEPVRAATPLSPPLKAPTREISSRDYWDSRIADSDFSHALTALRDAVKIGAPQLNFDDVVVALLALSVRPTVLLAGPPGCGKSTLVRTIAQNGGSGRGQVRRSDRPIAPRHNGACGFTAPSRCAPGAAVPPSPPSARPRSLARGR